MSKYLNLSYIAVEANNSYIFKQEAHICHSKFKLHHNGIEEEKCYIRFIYVN